jgi:transcription termination factor Rho
MSINITELEAKTREELIAIARDIGISGYTALKKQDLVLRLLQASAELQGNLLGKGVLDTMD